MKVCKPIKHLPKHIRRLCRAFWECQDEPIRRFIIEEMKYYKWDELARELEENELQNQLKFNNHES